MSGTIKISLTDLLNAIYRQLKSQITSEPEIAQQPYSYIIWTDGTTVYAKNGSTGQIEYSDTSSNAYKVIQYAIDKTVESGKWGTVFVKAGLYKLTDTIYLWSGVGLVGEKHGWCDIRTTQYTGTILLGNMNKPILKVAVHPNYVGADPMKFSVYKCFPYLANIAIFGSYNSNYGANNGIEITSEAGIYDFVMTGVLVGYVGGSGLYVDNPYVKIWITQSYSEFNQQHGVYANNVGLIAINEAYISYNSDNGVEIDSWGSIYITNSTIQRNQQGIVARGGYINIDSSSILTNNSNGIYITRLSNPVYVAITGSSIANNGDGTGTYSNIRIDSDRAVVAGNIIMDNRSPTKTTYHIYITGGWLLVEGNMFIGTPTGGIVNKTGGTLLIKNNIGYTTENGGTATFNGDGTTTQFKIAHGLASTPSRVIVTPASADASGSFYVTADSTYIYVNYFTAPPAGTNNVVIYWYAEV